MLAWMKERGFKSEGLVECIRFLRSLQIKIGITFCHISVTIRATCNNMLPLTITNPWQRRIFRVIWIPMQEVS
jgi:hypothetical protein